MQIARYIESLFPGGGQCKDYRDELIRVCSAFIESGFSDLKFVSDLTSGEKGKFWSCISEAIIFDKLKDKHFEARTKIGVGPDFLLKDGNRKIWIEVVCPQPMGVPLEWLVIKEGICNSAPHTEILLRWCSAIKEKSEKLLGSSERDSKGYFQTGVVSENDVYIIAVNGCQMRHGPFQALHGISQFPYALEAVFPVGPFQLIFDKTFGKIVDSGHQDRFEIINKNKASVSTYSFLDPRFSRISAIWAVDFNGERVIGNSEPSALIHNPLALNPLPTGFLQSDEEFVATSLDNGDYQLERIFKSLT